MKPARLLRWYPRAWRERYGGELAALIQDDLDEGRPAWRLRLSVIGGGLRERGRQARHAAAASVRRPAGHDRWGTILMAGLVCGLIPGDLVAPPAAAGAWQAVALDALLAAVALTGAIVAGRPPGGPARARSGSCGRAAGRRSGAGSRGRRERPWRSGAGSASVTGPGPGLVAGLPQLNASWAYWAGEDPASRPPGQAAAVLTPSGSAR